MQSGFIPINDPIQARQLLGRAVDHLVEIRFKLSNDPQWVCAKLSSRSTPTQALWFVPVASDLRKILDLVSASSGQSFIEGQAQAPAQVLLFLKGQVVLGIASQTLEVREGSVGVLLGAGFKVFKLQRRKAARFEIPHGYEPTVAVRDVMRRLYDISLSGLSFIVENQAAADPFKVGLMMHNIGFKLEGRSFTVSGQVCNHIPISEGVHSGRVKVGVRFIGLSPQDSEFIESYVAKQLFAYSGAGNF